MKSTQIDTKSIRSSELTNQASLDEVELKMTQLAVGTQLELAGAMVQEHISSGGKRIRARLALAAADSLGVGSKFATDWAAAVELLHNATLIHDDIQDGDRVRRGHPTLWVRHGTAQAINAGDLMLMLPTLALDSINVDDSIKWRLSHALSKRSTATVRGQCQEMSLLESECLDWGHYLRAAAGKTGQLLALPIEGAALLAGWSPEDAQALADEFIPLGVLYQLQDDTRDLFAEKGRGECGSDIREGKVSALVVAHLALHPNDKEWLHTLLTRPRDQTTNEDIVEATERFRTHGALDSVLHRIEELSEEIRTSALLAQNPALAAIAHDLVNWINSRLLNNDPTP
ncbi:MAG: polyprenyl synthetase family protein [Myxococcota bacterium]